MSSFLLDEQIPVEAVRWFYGRGSGHLNTWKSFRGADTINIENAYREYLRAAPDSQHTKIVVRNDLFEVDIEKRICSPIFWPGQRRSGHAKKTDWCDTPVQRGIWFNKINWIPLDFEMALIIENEHVTSVIPKYKNKPDDKNTLHKFSQDSYSVAWMSNGDVYLITRSAQPFGHLKLRGDLSSVPINRGFNCLADPNDRKPAITQLCFVVHGIGQQLASIRHECSKFKKACRRTIHKRYQNLEKVGQRLEFIPVDWRSALNLNCSTLENITIGQMRPLRMYINNCFVDVLYYTSPVYRAEIMKSLSWELTRLFNIFLRNNPHFLQKGGQVSVLAHSLGSVIMHDILRGSENTNSFVSPELLEEDASDSVMSPTMEMARRIEQTRNDLLNLELQFMRQISSDSQSPNPNGNTSYLSNFRRPESWKPFPQLSHLFLIGSPLGLFITLNTIPSTYNQPSSKNTTTTTTTGSRVSGLRRRRRNKSGHSSSECSPSRKSPVVDMGSSEPEALIPYFACRRVYNIFHSYDPIAYRIEPLLLSHYANISPVVLPNAGSFLSKNRKEEVRQSLVSDTERLEVRSPESDSAGTEGERSDGERNEERQDHGTMSFDSNTNSSDDDSTASESGTFSHKLYKRLSVTNGNQVYKQHKSRTFKLFSRLVTRRSSHVTSLGPVRQRQRAEPLATERRLRYRVDYEWQKSFSPLAVLGAHYSYWTSEELAFFILYQMFGHPDSLT
ncbi:putative phospholipase DDHD1 [Paragonimus heterotremus]|uniref:Putative phospholipase DDHD1 n=1 Tax=Paragonimus heterotremus TaxID=100268 RepID=A0A8J4T1U8_9TREM|nr:putative phospholipase DDHD1 [Paragonimus heterotremus]